MSKEYAAVNHTPHGESSIACPISFATLTVTHQAFNSVKNKEQRGEHCDKRHHENLVDISVISKSRKTTDEQTT